MIFFCLVTLTLPSNKILKQATLHEGHAHDAHARLCIIIDHSLYSKRNSRFKKIESIFITNSFLLF